MAKKKETEIIKCKFAGDPEDEYCQTCDGISVVIDDKGIETTPATDCGGYEPEILDQNNEKVPIVQENTSPIQISTNYTPQGVTTQIKAESGISKEIKGVWYKFTYSEERKLPETCDLEKEIQALWEHCNSVVDKQVEEVQNL